MFLLIDKPIGITSHDVIARLRRITGIRKIGHAGTLDPNASGLLIVGVGRESTKKLGTLTTDTTKTYEAEIALGEERDTDDVEGNVVESTSGESPAIETVESVIASFKGEQSQIPPVYSAIKKNGKKAYELARKGTTVSMEARRITVHSIELRTYSYPTLCIVVNVSSGTYIRALARDIGRKLGTYGYLSNLRRTEISDYSVKQAHRLEEINSDNWESLAVQL